MVRGRRRPPVLITTQNFAQTTPWFPDSLAEPTQELLPGATVEAVENGHLSRPDITATAVREMTS